jgi:hypothetical protein
MSETENLPTVAQPVGMTPMDILDRAVAKGADVATLEKLMDLQERWERNQARKAFDADMSRARAKMPVIAKNKRVHFKSKDKDKAETDYLHETLDEVVKTVSPILSEFGLSFRYRTASPADGPVSVTCIISHRDGHSEEITLSAPRDTSGNKNNIQGVGSVVTYLQRYTLKAALGLAAAADDDGKAAEVSDETLTEEERQKLKDMLDEDKADIARFCEYAKIDSLAEAPRSRFPELVKMIETRRKQVKAKSAKPGVAA